MEKLLCRLRSRRSAVVGFALIDPTCIPSVRGIKQSSGLPPVHSRAFDYERHNSCRTYGSSHYPTESWLSLPAFAMHVVFCAFGKDGQIEIHSMHIRFVQLFDHGLRNRDTYRAT